MPIKITYLDNGMGVLWLGQGAISGQDLLEASKVTFESIEKLKLFRYALVDFESIDKNSIQTGSIKSKALMDTDAATINPDIAIALIAKDELMFGLSRMWENYVYGIGWKTHVFKSRIEAEEWIKETVKEQTGRDCTLLPSGVQVQTSTRK